MFCKFFDSIAHNVSRKYAVAEIGTEYSQPRKTNLGKKQLRFTEN